MAGSEPRRIFKFQSRADDGSWIDVNFWKQIYGGEMPMTLGRDGRADFGSWLLPQHLAFREALDAEGPR